MKKANRFSRILLVNPPKVQQCGYTPPPLALMFLASYLREDNPQVTVEIYDAALYGEKGLKERISTYKPDLLGMTVLTPARHEALQMAGFTKKTKPECRVVLGGVHPSIMWQQMMENYPQIDFIVIGEGEVTLSELASNKPLEKIDGLVWRKQQKIIKNQSRKFIQNLDDLPMPAWELINPRDYPPWGTGVFNGINLESETRFPLTFSRGCFGTCTFCSSWRIWRCYRSRSGDKVADEVEFLYHRYSARHFYFCDDTLTGDRDEIIKFCREVARRKLKIALNSSTRVDLVDIELLRLMHQAGFYQLSFGIESGSKKMLTKINKKTDLAKIKKAIMMTKKAGIGVCALMMYGLPGEDGEDRQLTQKLLATTKPDEIGTIGEVWIFPGTALYEQAKTAGILNDRFWLTKKPYYIYRGGIDGDSTDWTGVIKDFMKFYFLNSKLGNLIVNQLFSLLKKTKR